MKLTISKMARHFCLIIRHKWAVLRHCAKCGLFFRGLIHDLSKFTPTEFFESARHFQGNRSPIGACRRETGVSYAWLHHKGRNKHHIEYWYDEECKILPLMPYKYAIECVCDKLAATKTYAGRDYDPSLPLLHWQRYGSKAKGNPKTKAFLEKVFTDFRDLGERAVLNKKYMKHTYLDICLCDHDPDDKPTAACNELDEAKSKAELGIFNTDS